jgi:hypothetical protein
VLIGHARAKYGSNSNGLREIGAESKIPALDPGVLRGGQSVLIEDVIEPSRPGRIDNLARGREKCKNSSLLRNSTIEPCAA